MLLYCEEKNVIKTTKRILLIEDEEAISIGVTHALEAAGYEVECAADGRTGLTRGLTAESDLILLDIMLPFVDGFEIAKQLREKGVDTPIIMLTAKGSEDDKLKGLSIAADDYITKPFSIKELLARVNAVLRRVKGVPEVVKLNDMTINFSRHEMTKGDQELKLTNKEAAILRYFIEHKERIVTRDDLLKHVWGYERPGDIETRTVDIYIVKLRGKLESDPNRPEIITTVRAKGYKFNGVVR